jgi:hypothetical protein
MTKYYAECRCDKKCASSKFRSCPSFIRKKEENKRQKKEDKLARMRIKYAEDSPNILKASSEFKHWLRRFSITDKSNWKQYAEYCMVYFVWWLYSKYR